MVRLTPPTAVRRQNCGSSKSRMQAKEMLALTPRRHADGESMVSAAPCEKPRTRHKSERGELRTAPLMPSSDRSWTEPPEGRKTTPPKGSAIHNDATMEGTSWASADACFNGPRSQYHPQVATAWTETAVRIWRFERTDWSRSTEVVGVAGRCHSCKPDQD